MCLSAYDLVCDECRNSHDAIFNPLTEKGDYSEQEETEAREKWYKSLCDACKAMLVEEGYIEE